MSEVVSHKQNKSSEIAEFFSQNEMLEDPVTRRDYFEHLDENDFLSLVQQTANLVRTGDSNQLQSFDGKTVSLMTHEVPDQREKEELLSETWRAALSILKDRKLGDQDALDYAGLTVAGGMLLTHPFIDGNGRTSRTLSHVIMRGTNHSDELQEILGNSSNSGGWSVAPSKRISFVRPYAGEQPDKIKWENDHFVGEGEDGFGGIFIDSDYRNNVIHRFIEQADEQTLQLVRQAMKSQVESTSGAVLDGDKLLEVLASSEGAVEYAQTLSALMRSERVLAIHAFLEGMKNGEIAFAAEHLNSIAESKGSESRERRAEKARHEIGKRSLANGTMAIRDQQLSTHKVYSSIYDKANTNNIAVEK